jgi:hypothetical protein
MIVNVKLADEQYEIYAEKCKIEKQNVRPSDILQHVASPLGCNHALPSAEKYGDICYFGI